MKNQAQKQAQELVKGTKMTFEQTGDGVFSCCLKYDGRQVTLTEYDVPRGRKPQLQDVLHNLVSMSERGFDAPNIGTYVSYYGHNKKLYSTVEKEFAEIQRLAKGMLRVYGQHSISFYVCLGLPVPQRLLEILKGV